LRLSPTYILNRPFVWRLLMALLLVLLPLAYFFLVVKGQLVLAIGDSWLYSLPMRMLLGQMIVQGTLPLWNPFTFAGMPFLATTQPGVLYPPNWLFAILPPGAALNAVRWSATGAGIIALHVLAGLPQATVHLALVCGPYALFSLFLRTGRPQNRSARWRFAAAVLVMAVCGALLSAIQLLPARELQLQGERAAIPYESKVSGESNND
jgi:hypothetical protein